MKKFLLALILLLTVWLFSSLAAYADNQVIYGNALTPGVFTAQTESAPNGATPAEIKQAEAQAMQAYFEKWKISLTPYLFLFKMKSSMAVGDRASDSMISTGQVQSMLNRQFNLRLDVNKAHWGAFIDTCNLGFNKVDSVSSLNSNFNLSAVINHYCAYYRFAGLPILDLYGGARTYSFNADVTLTLGGLPVRSFQSANPWSDVIFGARITQPLSKNLNLTLGGDGGGFSGSHNSSSLYGLLGWQVGPALSLNAGYDVLHFVRTKPVPLSQTFTMDATMSGPMVSVGINF